MPDYPGGIVLGLMLAPVWSSWAWACLPGDVWASPFFLQLVKTEGHCTLIYLVLIRWLEQGRGLVLLSAFSLST